jgi:hypothetical protein
VASILQWIHGRASSVANTFVPLWLFLLHPREPSINSITGLSPPIVHFYFQYWTTFPFAVGIVVFPWILAAVVRFTREHPWMSSLVVVLPPVVFAIYWGESLGGLMREGLQVWLVGVMIVFAWQTWGRAAS